MPADFEEKLDGVPRLLRMPRGERRRHCWLANPLRDALAAVGFGAVALEVQGWRTGDQWFDPRASRLGAPPSDPARVRAALGLDLAAGIVSVLDALTHAKSERRSAVR